MGRSQKKNKSRKPNERVNEHSKERKKQAGSHARTTEGEEVGARPL